MVTKYQFLTALESQKSKAEDKLRDEIRTLHEAYQFLSRKYIKLAETLGQMNQEELEAYAKKKEEERKGQAHDIFSRIFQIRIYKFILYQILCSIFFDFLKCLKLRKK